MRAALLAILALAAAPPAAARAEEPVAADLRGAMQMAQARVVKIYGTAVGRVKGYGSGVLVSGDGLVLTTLTSLLEGGAPRVVLPDGRTAAAAILARDARRQIALLKVSAGDLACFSLDAGSANLEPGAWVITAANSFKVADGPEAVSVSVGVFAGRAPLAARRRAQEQSPGGEVLLIDAITAVPGAAGGAVVDAQGRLVGMIGKEVESTRTNTWLNYAITSEELAAFVDAFRSGTLAEDSPAPSSQRAPRADHGLRLFDVGGRVRPPYVERIVPGSPAARAGLRADDLLLRVDDQALATCADFEALLARRPTDVEFHVTYKRGEQVHTALLRLAPQE